MVNQAVQSSAFAVRRERGDILARNGGDGEKVAVGVRESRMGGCEDDEQGAENAESG